MADNCSPCNSTPAPCQDCTQVLQQINYCDDGCVDTVHSDCVISDAGDITLPNGTVIYANEMLTTVIQKLAKNNASVTLGAYFNATSRILTLTNNGVPYASLTIGDQDNQYLALDGTMLQIWTNVTGGSAIMINEVDISSLLVETTFAATSTTLLITPAGKKGHNPSIELPLSKDTGNKALIGSDGYLFVPPDTAGIKDVVIQNVQGISFSKTVTNGVITFIPQIDFQYFADQICPLCNPACGTPSNLNVQSV